MVEGVITELPSPIKSSNDKKEYKVIRLPNGLTALLISDTSYDLDKLDQEEAQLVENVGNDDEEMEEEEEDDDEMEDSEGEDDDDDDEDDVEENEVKTSGKKKGKKDDHEEDEEDDDDDDEEGAKKKSSSAKKLQVTSGLRKAAAGLCVGMGSFSDPDELPGLAHFLEHMVFMGSKKYPSENGFDKYISKHGGFDNAHTDCENTTFYFEVQRKHLPTAIDMFAQFFIEPLMQKKAMKREREAVDSEYQMALPSDYIRKENIFGTLAKKNHPMTKFMWGNKESLTMGKLSDDVVHKKLHEFKDRHYTSQSMTLVVQSQETIDTLQKLVVDAFSRVPNNGLPKETFASLSDPFNTLEFNKIYKIVPLENVYQLDLFWSLPPLLDKYKSKPLSYLSWIIGHEGKGSLILYLRKKVWALSLTAGNEGDGFEMNATHTQFTINIVLTQSGFECIDQVISVVFSYLKMLNEAGPNERIFSEIKEIEDLNFKYREEPQPIENVEELCENMQIYPPELIIIGSELMFEFDPDLISSCASKLSPDKVCIFLTAREFSDEVDRVERWFKTNYKVEDIPDAWKSAWKSLEVYPELFLPSPNKFIAKDLSLKTLDPSHIQAYPIRLIDESYGECFFKFDTTFNQPRAIIRIHVIVPPVRDNLENSVCMDLLVSCLTQQMIRDTYPADLAQLQYSVHSSERGFQLSISGLNDKIHLLLDTILGHFASFEDNFEEEMFEAVRVQVKKNYYNTFIKPEKLVKELRLFLMQDVYRGKMSRLYHDQEDTVDVDDATMSAREKHKIISNVTAEKVKAFHKNMYTKPLFVQALVQGNMTPEEAILAFEATAKTFNNEKSKPIEVPEIAVKRIPEKGTKILRVDGFNLKDNNTMITNYYQFGPGTLMDYMHLEVGCQLMEEPVFDILRTKEQLGYYVFSMLRNTHGILGCSVTVNSQATKFTPDHVDERIEAFLDWFANDKLANLSDDEFNLTISTLIKMKSQADITLAEEVSRNWGEINCREYLFDRHQREIKLLENCDKAEMVKFVLNLIDAKNANRRKLSVQVVGSSVINNEATVEDNPDEEIYDIKYRVEGDNFINDIWAYKSTLTTYPITKIVE